MNSLKSNLDRSHLSPQGSNSPSGLAGIRSRFASAATAHLFTANGEPVLRWAIMGGQFSDSYFDEGSRKKLYATGDVSHSRLSVLEGENRVSPKSIVTSSFEITQSENNTIVVPRELFIGEIIQLAQERRPSLTELEAKLRRAQSNKPYANTNSTTDYLKGVTAPIAWEVRSYTPSRGGLILNLSRPSTTQDGQNRTLRLSIGETELGQTSSAFLIAAGQHVSGSKFNPTTGKTTTGGLVIMGHSAGSEGPGSGLRNVSPALQTTPTVAGTKMSVSTLLKNLFGSVGKTTEKPSTINQPFKSSFDSIMAQEMALRETRNAGRHTANDRTQSALTKLKGELFV
jgi:hypothetical protein